MRYKSSQQILKILSHDLDDLSRNKIKDLLHELQESLKEESSLQYQKYSVYVSVLNTIKANVRNDKLSDIDFRDFVFNSVDGLEAKEKNKLNSGNFFIST